MTAPYECGEILKHEFYASWQIDISNSFQGSVPISKRTEVFSPISNSDVSFYFECCYIKDSEENFKAILVKSRGVNIPEGLKLNVKISVNLPYANEEKNYFCNGVIVKNMDKISLNNEIIFKNFLIDNYFEEFSVKSYGKCSIPERVELTSRLVFYNHFDSYTEHCYEMRLLKNLKNFASDFSCLYESQEMSDVELKIGNESFPVHKTILSAHSPVFQKMLSQDFLESRTNTITISDSTTDIFQSFLKYFYSGEIEDKTWETVTHLYALADKYDVRTLKRECAEVISSLLSVDVACEALLIAYKYDDEDLKFHAKKFAFQHVLELLPRDEWKEMIQTNPTIGYEVMLNFATPKHV